MIHLFILAAIRPARAASEPIQLPHWKQPPNGKSTPFRIGTKFKRARVWGRGLEPARVYFDEFLPALFERTLVFKDTQLEGKEKLDWIFTGQRGGITVTINHQTLTLCNRFYDSYGLSPIEGKVYRAGRHPEKYWLHSEISYTGNLQSVTVKLDHKLNVIVALNGLDLIKQECVFDLSRHQLRITGSNSHVQGDLLIPPRQIATVHVDPTQRHQTMLGFGGIATPTAYAQLSEQGKRKWWQYVAEYNLLIQREYPNGERLNPEMDNFDKLDDATPHYYGDNFPNGEISDFNYIKTLRQLDGMVFFEFWNFPPWVTQPYQDKNGKPRNRVADPDKTSALMVHYCRLCKERTGKAPEVVGIQNERSQPTEIWHQMTLTLRRKLDEAGFKNTRIHMADAGWLHYGTSFAKRFQESPEAWRLIDFSATHMYDYQNCFYDPDAYDTKLEEFHNLTNNKPFLSTELCINRPQFQRYSYRLAFAMGQLYHKNLTITDASSICYCWTLLNVVQPSYGWTRTLFVPDLDHGFTPKPSSYQLRIFGAFSRRIHKDMTRIGATSSQANLLVSAFAGSKGQYTLILLNRSPAVQQIKIENIDTRFTFIEYVDPYHQNTVQSIPTSAIKVLPGQLITLSNVPLNKLPDNFKMY